MKSLALIIANEFFDLSSSQETVNILLSIYFKSKYKNNFVHSTFAFYSVSNTQKIYHNNPDAIDLMVVDLLLCLA